MKKCLWILLLALMTSFAYAQVYKWVDSQGNVHFSDNPHQGAQEIQVPPSQLYSSPPPPSSNQQDNQTTENNQTASEPQNNIFSGYKSLTIIQPINQATVRNNNGIVSIAAKVVPNLLQQGDQFQLIYDGEPLGSPQPSSSFILNNVYRGTHTITMEIVDANGKVQISSDQVTFFMHRARVGGKS